MGKIDVSQLSPEMKKASSDIANQKAESGKSSLQEKVDRLNFDIGIGVGIFTTLATGDLSLYYQLAAYMLVLVHLM